MKHLLLLGVLVSSVAFGQVDSTEAYKPYAVFAGYGAETDSLSIVHAKAGAGILVKDDVSKDKYTVTSFNCAIITGKDTFEFHSESARITPQMDKKIDEVQEGDQLNFFQIKAIADGTEDEYKLEPLMFQVVKKYNLKQ